MITFRFPTFRLNWDPSSGACFTFYRDGTKSGCGVVPEDSYHGERLDLTPEQHRLQHELAHHLVGYALYGFDGSPVVWRDAQGVDQLEGGEFKPGWTEAAREEWVCNGIQYLSRDRDYEDGKAIAHAEESGVDVQKVAEHLALLMSYAISMAKLGNAEVRVDPIRKVDPE